MLEIGGGVLFMANFKIIHVNSPGDVIIYDFLISALGFTLEICLT
jgi:hypothetical protein